MLRFMPPVTRALILVNVAVYLLEMATGNALTYEFALWPINPGLWQGPSFEPIQLVTYSFLHGSIPHLAFNMLALYMFGSDVERLLGTQRYTTLYFAAVIAAALTQLIVSSFVIAEPYPTVGASGGVFGLLLAFGRYFGNRTVILLIPPIPMPARVFVFVYGALELFLGVTGTEEGVAHFAHLGGMLGAWLVIRRWRRR